MILIASGSSVVGFAHRVGQPGRWVALAALLAVSIALVVVRRVPLRMPPVVIAAAALAGIGIVSTGWSVLPGITLQRAVSFAVLLLAAALLSTAAAADATLARRLIGAIAVAAGLLALAGIVVYLARSSLAMQSATPGTGGRLRGFGENPNTLPMLYAVALPSLAWLGFTAFSWRGRLLWLATALLLLGSISASGSRGAMIGALPATLLVAVLSLRGRLLLVAFAATVAAFAIAVGGTTVAVPSSSAPVAGSQAPAVSLTQAAVPDPVVATAIPSPAAILLTDGHAADRILDLENDPNEIGRPRISRPLVEFHRTMFGSSGRAQAWDGGLRQSLQRPLLGYGFGTEDQVFIDHYYVFESGRIENSYLGLWLQVGAVGLALFLLLLALLALHLLRGWRSLRSVRGVGVAGAGIALSGAVMALPQSYVYSVGNVATAAFWIGALLLGLTVLRKDAA